MGLFSYINRKTNIATGKMFRPITSRSLKKRLNNNDFTMVSSNCIGSRFYQELVIPYNTPFVGLFIYAPCYIKMLGDLEYYLKSDLTFIAKSKYDEILPPEKRDRGYPIGQLGDIEIQFLHYHAESEVKEKWTRRIKRMNKENIFVTFTDRDLCTEEHLNQFERMNIPRKVCFTAKEYPEIKSSVWVNEYKNEPHVGDLYTEYYNLKKHFDFVDWLNGGTGRLSGKRNGTHNNTLNQALPR